MSAATASYDALRTQEQLARLDPALTQFVGSFNPGAPTIFFFPGGMASSLVQASVTVDQGPPYDYDLIWVSAGTLFGGAGRLAMHGSEDANRQMTIADGVISFLGVTPYSAFQAWCEQRTVPFNYLLIPWDWRLPLQVSVAFLLDHLFPRLQSKLKNNGFDLYSSEYHLIGHSFGGLIVKLILNGKSELAKKATRAITVGTPFYGYGTSQHFFFSGFSYLNLFYSKSFLSRTIASIPGPHVLLFLRRDEHLKYGSALKADPHYPLASYPSLDAVAKSEVDPFQFAPDRYPPWVSHTALKDAAADRDLVAKPLPKAITQKLSHIRGVTTRRGKPVTGTFVAQQWATIGANFDPDTTPDPIGNNPRGFGDDVIAAWSARLVGAPHPSVLDVSGADVDHMILMDLPRVQKKLDTLIPGARTSNARITAAAAAAGPAGPAAAPDEAAAFLRALAETRSLTVAAGIVQRQDPEFLRMIGRRLLRDFLKPEAKAEAPVEPEAEAPVRRERRARGLARTR